MKTKCSGQFSRCNGTCRRWSGACPNGWRGSKSLVPSPWEVAASYGDDLKLVRIALDDTGRYYDESRTIVLRAGALLEEERRILWHELAHAARRDTVGHTDDRVERLVERHAAENAMPWVSIVAAWDLAADLTEMAGLLKLPEAWVYWRLTNLHPAQKAALRVRRPADEVAPA